MWRKRKRILSDFAIEIFAYLCYTLIGKLYVMKGGYEINLDIKDFDVAFEFCMSLFND